MTEKDRKKAERDEADQERDRLARLAFLRYTKE